MDHDNKKFRLMVNETSETIPDDDTPLHASLLFDGVKIHAVVQQ